VCDEPGTAKVGLALRAGRSVKENFLPQRDSRGDPIGKILTAKTQRRNGCREGTVNDVESHLADLALRQAGTVQIR
jgi:hypothetical protein